MHTDSKISLLAKVARASNLSQSAAAPETPGSILTLAAAAYGARPSDDTTVPTGFDPVAASLFEAIVEGAYLVASADGNFDDDERKTFERLVVTACGGSVAPRQIAALLSDLEDQLTEDGLERRVSMLSKLIRKKEHGREVLRIAALLALASEGISDVERDVLSRLAKELGFESSEVDAAVADVNLAMQSAT